METQRKYGAVLSYLNIIIKNLVTFIYTPILLRTVGQAEYGLFQMTNSVVMSLSLLSMGFSSAYVKFYITYKVQNKKKEIDKLNGIYLLIFLTISIMALIIGLILTFNTTRLFGKSLTLREVELTKKLMFILVINVALTFPSSVFDANILVNQRFVFQQSRQIIQSILVPIISIALILMGSSVLAVGVTQMVVTFLFLLLNLRYCLKKLNMQFDFSGFPPNLFKQLVYFSSFILLNQVVDLVNNNGPNFVLGMFMGAKDVAIFAVAIQIKNMFFMLSSSLSTVFVPRVNEIVNQENNNKILMELMIKVGRLQMSLLFFILGGFIVLGQYFIDLWAGVENKEAYWLIIIMVLPSIIPLSQNIGIEIQRAMNKHIFRSIAYSIFAILNILITILGTIHWGLIGATLGYVLSIIFANGFLMNWYYQNRMQLNMKEFWLNTGIVIIPFLFATSVLMIIQIFLPVDSLIKFLGFGIVYVGIYGLIYIKFIANKFERRQISSFLKR